MAFPPNVKVEALILCDRRCCVCHKFKGQNIECHHIIQESDGGANTLDNCVPLCFDCHASVGAYDHNHPRGTKFRPEELRGHRDKWYQRVSMGLVPKLSDTVAADTVVFNSFREKLPYQPFVRFLEEQDFGGDFRRARLDPLRDYDDHFGDPSAEFLDSDLESLRADFAERSRAFLTSIAKNTFPEGPGHEFCRVSRDWAYQQQKQAQKELNNLANSVCESYNTLIREARRRLEVG